jgi:tRNA (guanine-N7-)-methyltransferase
MKPKNLKAPYTWEERRPLLQDGVLHVPDYYERHEEFSFPGWPAIFGNDKPVVIEYCTGNGTWLAEKAKDTSKNWVAVEWRFERVRKIWSKTKNYNLSNLFIISGEAQVFARKYLPDASVDEVYVNFPDPWPKEKHAKNRLFQQPFIAELARTIKQNGTVTVATDDPCYSEQIFKEMLAQGSWQSVFGDPGYKTEWERYGESYFDTLWREKGKTIRYFQFRRL